MNTEIQNSYAACRRAARQAASSFYLSFLMLPRSQREAMCALYGFHRQTHEIAKHDAPLLEQKER